MFLAFLSFFIYLLLTVISSFGFNCILMYPVLDPPLSAIECLTISMIVCWGIATLSTITSSVKIAPLQRRQVTIQKNIFVVKWNWVLKTIKTLHCCHYLCWWVFDLLWGLFFTLLPLCRKLWCCFFSCSSQLFSQSHYYISIRLHAVALLEDLTSVPLCWLTFYSVPL